MSPHGPCLPEGRWRPCRPPDSPSPSTAVPRGDAGREEGLGEDALGGGTGPCQLGHCGACHGDCWCPGDSLLLVKGFRA